MTTHQIPPTSLRNLVGPREVATSLHEQLPRRFLDQPQHRAEADLQSPICSALPRGRALLVSSGNWPTPLRAVPG